MTALNSLPRSFPWNKALPPPLVNYVTDCKVSGEQKVGNLTYVPWRYVLGVHMRKETHSDYFLNPSTVLCIQLGAVATGSSWLLLSFFCAFSQGLSERIAQLEVIFIFLILVLIIQILPQVKCKTSIIFKPLEDSPIQSIIYKRSNFSSCLQSLPNNPWHWRGLSNRWFLQYLPSINWMPLKVQAPQLELQVFLFLHKQQWRAHRRQRKYRRLQCKQTPG